MMEISHHLNWKIVVLMLRFWPERRRKKAFVIGKKGGMKWKEKKRGGRSSYS